MFVLVESSSSGDIAKLIRVFESKRSAEEALELLNDVMIGQRTRFEIIEVPFIDH